VLQGSRNVGHEFQCQTVWIIEAQAKRPSVIREPVGHTGRIQLALELPDRCISLHFERDAAMKTAACGELLGMKERCLLNERKHIPWRHLVSSESQQA
jgi:hypothetical protein